MWRTWYILVEQEEGAQEQQQEEDVAAVVVAALLSVDAEGTGIVAAAGIAVAEVVGTDVGSMLQEFHFLAVEGSY